MKDVFYFLDKSTLYNYENDNTSAFSISNLNLLEITLENESKIRINWFDIYEMQFQAIAVGKITNENLKQFQTDNVKTDYEDCVILLGVYIDFLLNFYIQVNTICTKAANQLNVL